MNLTDGCCLKTKSGHVQVNLITLSNTFTVKELIMSHLCSRAAVYLYSYWGHLQTDCVTRPPCGAMLKTEVKA